VGPTQPPVQWVPCLFSRGKETGLWHWSHTQFRNSRDIIVLPFGPSCSILGWNERGYEYSLKSYYQ